MIEYGEIAKALGVMAGDKIWLSSELLQYALLYKKNNTKFDPNELINAFQAAVGEEGTILIPTFSFDFSSKGFYDVKKTKGIVGVLGNAALKRDDFVRTTHPMHSFAVWGKDSEMLANMGNKHSFGMDSPFGYCLGNHVKQIILGTDYVHALTFVHYAEAVCNVPYRFAKSFTGTYVDVNGEESVRTYDYAARKLEVGTTEIFNNIGLELEKQSVSKKIMIEGIENYVIDLAKSFPIICDDIVNNKCKNIYDFSIPRETLFP